MRPRIPWSRLGAEGAVIVASILLALAAQAWWEGRQEKRQEAEYLMALQRELGAARLNVRQSQGQFARNLHYHEALIGQFRETDLAPRDSLAYWLSSLSWPAPFDPPTAVLNDLVSSGGIQLIESDSLRLLVARYDGLLTRFNQTSDQAWAAWTDRIQSYLEGRVPRVDRLREGTYPRPIPFGASPFVSAYDTIFADPTFESMIAERWIRLDVSRTVLEEILLVMTQVEALIDRELGTRDA